MLVELKNVRQISGEACRRWFSSPEMDLIIWHENDGKLAGFELCYDKDTCEKSFYMGNAGQLNMLIDNGENRPGKYKSSPLVIRDTAIDAGRLKEEFILQSENLPQDIIEFVLSAITDSLLPE